MKKQAPARHAADAQLEQELDRLGRFIERLKATPLNERDRADLEKAIERFRLLQRKFRDRNAE